MVKGLIADIQRASFHDGYGMRTTVFFKGCPLHCEWCHNPECISAKPEYLYYPEKCIGCGKCDEGCFASARVLCGKEYTANELLEEIRRDIPYYGDKGGVTFSGGEPMLQKEFLSEAIEECKKNGIGCAVETSMIIYDESVYRQLDFIMADLKIWDERTHQKHTGIGNKAIKKNFRRLNRLGIPIIARTPVIPGINQGIEEISAFLKGLSSVVKYELLPYHPLGLEKAKAMGIEMTRFDIPNAEYMKEIEKYVFVR